MVSLKANIGTVRGGRDARAAMKSVVDNYRKVIRHISDVTPEILLEALEPTFEKSQEYCPVDTGALKESGYLQIVQVGDRPQVQIGYGFGGSPPYTVKVHENLEYRHEPPTRAKWLQVALEEDEGQIEARILAAYKEVFS